MTRSRLAVSFGERLDLDLVVGEEAPPAAQALVVAQDVNLIMGEVEPVEEGSETADDLLARSADARPRKLGSLLVASRGEGAPLLLQAVVYDFDRSPPAREEHVFAALITAFEEMRSRGLACLAVRPVGTAYAGLEPERFLRLLTQVCYTAAEMGTTLRRVHLLLASPDEMRRYESLLQELARGRARKGGRSTSPP